jgi:peptide/nickel transport system substrate-binding protein
VTSLSSGGISRRTLLGAGGAAALALGLAACGSGNSASSFPAGAAAGQARKGGVLRIARPPASSGELLDPASSLSAYEYLGALYNRLVRRDGSGNTVADLATQWQPNADATQWTFLLRQGVTFHNGKPFTSADAAYTIKHILDPATKSPQAGVLSIVDPAAITTPDDHTLVLGLKTPHAEFPSLLTHYNCYIIPDGSAASIGKTGIGTGPFSLKSFTPAAQGEVTANPNYYAGRPTVDSIVFSAIADVQARVNALLAKQVDVLAQTPLDYANAKSVQAGADTTVTEVKNAQINVLPMLTTAAGFTDVRIRQAFKLAYDPVSVLKVAAQNYGTVAHDNPVAPDDPYYVNYSVQPDPDKAKALLKQAGAENLQVDLYTSDYQSGFTPLALAFKDSVARAGITLNIKNAPSDSYYTNVWMKQPLCVSYWYTGRGIDQLLNEFFRSGSSYNETAWSDSTMDRMLDSARRETDQAKRKQLYQDAQKYVVDNSGLLVPFFGSRLTGLSKQVVNYSEHGFEFDYVHIGLRA